MLSLNPNLFTFSISSVSVSDPYPQNTKTFNNNKCCESKSWKETRVSGVSRGGGGGTESSSGSSGDCFLQNGGFAMALLSITSIARGRLSPFMATLAANPTFLSGMLAWMIAQSMKMFLNFFVESKWDFRIIFASGGMPSSHSALCTALTTSVAISHGVADSLFPVCLGFSLIVMYDAIGVRRHAGMQAQVLNVIIADLFQGHPISQRKLKELLGHTPSQVFAGAVLGILVAAVCCRSYLVAASVPAGFWLRLDYSAELLTSELAAVVEPRFSSRKSEMSNTDE